MEAHPEPYDVYARVYTIGKRINQKRPSDAENLASCSVLEMYYSVLIH